jgi:DNA-binding NarL/FixJ family response regulator
MENRSIQILSLEADPVIQSGLIACLNRFADLHVVAQAQTVASAEQMLAEAAARKLRDRIGEPIEVDLIIVGLPLRDRPNATASLNFCQQVKATYPNLPILLIAEPQSPDLGMAFQIGIDGCCLRGSSILDLVASIRRVAAGETSWAPAILQQVSIGGQTRPLSWRERLRLTSLQQIETTLAQVSTNLNTDRLSALDRAILTGRARELKTARWLVKRLLSAPDPVRESDSTPPMLNTSSQLVLSSPLAKPERVNQPLQNLFERIAAKLQSNLENLTSSPLEIDILRSDKKRELFYLILQQFEGLIDELRFSQVTIDQLSLKLPIILQDLWASVTTDFFGRYHTLSTEDRHVEIIPILLQDVAIVQSDILAKISQPSELFNYLLFKTPLTIDNTICAFGSPEAEDRAGALLENLTIHMANAVMQPLLNRFGNLESMKSGFYDRRLLSSREIERFRNNLSWRYRIDRYLSEPQAIFESEYRLFIFTAYGIKRTNIYAPRPQELERLTGIPLAVTLTLELRDALSPRLRSATTFLGSSVVYLLTEIIGRGIGLIGRGIIKGIGNIWQETNRNR